MKTDLWGNEISDLELKEFKGIKAWVRPGTSDSFVVEEVFSGEYNKLNITEDDVILDIGLNIGMFTLFALKKGAKRVIGFEAEVENKNLAAKNISENNLDDKAELYNLAVVGTEPLTRGFSINTKKNRGAHSLIHKRSRNTVVVNCIKFNELVEKYRPTLIKMDIEGGEYECLTNIDNYYDTKEIILEFHHAHLNDQTQSKQMEIVENLQKHFKKVDYREEPKGAWVSIIHAYEKYIKE
jgi:FkbM family methyltransferase